MFRSSDDSTPSRFHPTEADLITYRDLARALGAPPNEAICRYLGAAGQHLVFIGDPASVTGPALMLRQGHAGPICRPQARSRPMARFWNPCLNVSFTRSLIP